jgi:sugar/nucleoside kinase (ribokinase family)
MKIFTCGAVSWNQIVHLYHFFKPVPDTVWAKRSYDAIGGTGAGKALNLRKLGFDVLFHSVTGDDSYGRWIEDYLKKAGIQTVLDLDPAGTERHTNLMDPEGRRISIYTHSSSFDPGIRIDRIEAMVAQCDLVALNITNYCRKIIPLAVHYSKPVWCDIHDYDPGNPYHDDFIRAASVLQISSNKIKNPDRLSQKLLESGKEVVIMTHGHEGSVIYSREGTTPRLPVIDEFSRRMIDTNGAGDSYFSGFLFGRMQGCSLKKSAQLATIAAGLCITSESLAYEGLNSDLLLKLHSQYFQ